MPRTMCFTSASGCSFVGLPGIDGLCRRDQSVLDFAQADIGFALRCLAEGDDADFIFGLRVNDGHWDASQQAKRFEPLLTIGEAVVLKGEGRALKDSRCINEVEAVLLEIDRTLAL